MKTMKRLMLAAVVAVGSVLVASADSIRVDSVIQRWPWSNKTDITYTVDGGQDVAAGVFCRIVFNATIDGQTYVIDGVTNVGANASSGTHTVTWTPPEGLRTDNCSMTATLLSATRPSGNDYMIVNLQTGAISYEGLLATQSLSNERYNTALYKTTNMVFRKIARTVDSSYPNGYQTGYSDSDIKNNSPTNWVTYKDYYIGIFPVTQAQYKEVKGSNPSGFKSDDSTRPWGMDYAVYRPVETVSWNDLRGTDVAATNAPKSSAFLGLFNTLTANASGVTGFDLPTEVMFEIAQRAGNTGAYSWSGTEYTRADCCIEGSNSGSHTCMVGVRQPNGWGLYDTAGNVMEICLDDTSLVDMKDAPDPWTPAWSGSSADRRMRGGYLYNGEAWRPGFKASFRGLDTASKAYSGYGFRMAFLEK